MKAFRKAYNLTEHVDLLSGNSLQIFNRLTRETQKEISKILQSDPDQFDDQDFLQKLNDNLASKYAYMIVRKGNTLIFDGNSHITQGNLRTAAQVRRDRQYT